MTFAELEYDSKKRRTRREIFLEKMEGDSLASEQIGSMRRLAVAAAPIPHGVMLRVIVCSSSTT